MPAAKLNRDLIKEVCSHLERGLFRRASAALVGIDETTFSRWYHRGANADERGVYREFYLSVNKAEATLQSVCTDMIRSGGAGNPKLILSFLGRRFPSEYGRRDNVEEARPEDQAATTQALRDAILERLEKLLPDEPAPAAPAAPPESPNAE